MKPSFLFGLLIFLYGPALLCAQDSIPAMPGRLIDLGGYRIHVNQQGTKKPVVILISGAGDFSFDWSVIQSALSRQATVVSYDRAGEAWSDLGPTPRTMHQEAREIHLLLQKTALQPPYLLVGHSIGGLIARVYARLYPREVGGMLLLDPTHEDTKLNYQGKIVRVRDAAKGRKIPGFQTMQTSPPAPPSKADIDQYNFNRQVFGAPRIDTPFVLLPENEQRLRLWALSNPKLSASTEDYWPEELDAMHTYSVTHKYPLKNIPLQVLIAGRDDKVPEGMNPQEWKALNEEKRTQKQALAKLSTNGKAMLVKDSGHHIYIEKPEVVLSAIAKIIRQMRGTRSKQHL